MLDEQWWGLAILMSQKLARALPKPTWRVLLGGTRGEALRIHSEECIECWGERYFSFSFFVGSLDFVQYSCDM
jgi:hypothetical protein